MQETGGSLICAACGSLVEAPAFFCDMCGVRLPEPALTEAESPAPPATAPAPDWREPAIRFGIPAAVAAVALLMILSKNPSARTTFYLLFPSMIGMIVGAINVAQVNEFFNGLYRWNVRKLETRKDGEGKRHRFFYRPWHWLLLTAGGATTRIENPAVRAGVTAGAFLYILGLFVFVAYVAVSIIIAIALLAIVSWVFFFFADGGSSSVTVKRVETPRKVRIKPDGSLDLPPGTRIAADGRILEEGFVDVPTGMRIDKNGRIWEEGFVDVPAGTRINKEGQMVREGFVDVPTGTRIDKDGRIIKEGFVDVPTGDRIKKDGRVVKDGLF